MKKTGFLKRCSLLALAGLLMICPAVFAEETAKTDAQAASAEENTGADVQAASAEETTGAEAPELSAAEVQGRRHVKIAFPIRSDHYTESFFNKLSEYTGWELEYITFDNMTTDEAIREAMDMVASGEADLMGSMFKTDATKDRYLFPKESYGKIYTTLLTLDSSTITRLDQYDEERPLRVAVLAKAHTRNAEAAAYLQRIDMTYEFLECESSEEQLSALETGAADVMTGMSSETVANTRIVNEFAPRTFYAAFAPSDQALVKEFEDAFERLETVQPFYLDELSKKYFETEKYDYTSVTLPEGVIQKDHVIRVLAIDGDAPYFFLDESGQPAGVMYEILKMFARSTGQEIRFDICRDAAERGEWLEKDQYDFVMGSAFTTETCQKYHFVQSTAVMVEPLVQMYRTGTDPNRETMTVAVIAGAAEERVPAGTVAKEYENVETIVEAIDKGRVDTTWVPNSIAEFYIKKKEANVECTAIYDSEVEITIAVSEELSAKYAAYFNLFLKSIGSEEIAVLLQEANHHAEADPVRAFVRSHPFLVTGVVVFFIAAVLLIVFLLFYIRMKAVKTALEKENRHARQKLERDPLTGVYNRRGYQDILKRCREEKRPVAYIQLDIDNFKTLNDTYGHAFGDQVLKKTAEELVEAFRAEDYVFRFGGDEFAVLLVGFNEGMWKAISDKQQMVHIRINQQLQKQIYVTLSMGISWSPAGFRDELVALADEALYYRKKNGRGGCCVMDQDQKVIYEWLDEMGNNTESNPLTQSETGAFRIEFPNGDLARGQLVCNETGRAIMGLSDQMTPEECFGTWAGRIDPMFRETVEKTRDEMITKGQAECTYAYRHPLQGRILVRSGGKCVHNQKGIVFYGYHQSLQDTRIVLQVDDSQRLVEAMTRLYFASNYISLREDRYYTFKGTEASRHLETADGSASEALERFIQTLVSPEDQESVRTVLDLDTAAQRLKERPFLEVEYKSLAAEKGWCRVRLLPVRTDEKGQVTHVLLLFASIDRVKRERMAREETLMNALKIQLRVAELVSKTKIVQTGEISKKTGKTKVWLNAVAEGNCVTCSFEDMKEWGRRSVALEDADAFEQTFDLTYILEQVKKSGSCTMTFGRINEDGSRGVITHHYETLITDPDLLLMVIEDVTGLQGCTEEICQQS